MFQLKTTDASGSIVVYPLLKERVRIGSDEDNDVVLRSPEVAPHHAVLHVVEDVVRIEDLGTRGGSTVDHVRARGDEVLAAGSEILLGRHVLVLETLLPPFGLGGQTIVVGPRTARAFLETIGSDLAGVVVDGDGAHDAPPAPVEVSGRFVPLAARRIQVAAFPLIQVLSGPETGQRFLVDSDEFMIGRGGDCRLCLSDPEVRPDHCVIRKEERGYILYDRSGDAPATVNGRPVRQVLLSAEDRITVGGTDLLFRQRSVREQRPAGAKPPWRAENTPGTGPGPLPERDPGWAWMWPPAALILLALACILGYLLIPDFRSAIAHAFR